MLTKEQREEFNEILEELGNSLDISKTQYDAAVKSYTAVGEWLSQPNSILYPYTRNLAARFIHVGHNDTANIT